ncbi:MAG: hypothetical protein MZU95_12350 [Desulfomicrobium escambiense]|nr:hypothetical protein [Desulfomicrobium escambiense]
MARHLVLVGAGHAHLMTLKNLREFTARGHRVTVVSADAYHYYSGMGPGMLSGIYRPQDIRFHVKRWSRTAAASLWRTGSSGSIRGDGSSPSPRGMRSPMMSSRSIPVVMSPQTTSAVPMKGS